MEHGGACLHPDAVHSMVDTKTLQSARCFVHSEIYRWYSIIPKFVCRECVFLLVLYM